MPSYGCFGMRKPGWFVPAYRTLSRKSRGEAIKIFDYFAVRS